MQKQPEQLRGEQSTVLEMVDEVIHSPSVPLDPAVRARAEGRLGQDFSGVRVHTDKAAARSAEAAQASAYTVGSHIAFGSGAYSPGSAEGQRLILHELIHVAQQRLTAEAAPAPVSITEAHDASECEARALVEGSSISGSPPHIASRPGAVVARYDPKGAEMQTGDVGSDSARTEPRRIVK